MNQIGMRHEATGNSKTPISFLTHASRLTALACALALAGCMLPIRSEDMPAVLNALADSNASACLRTGARGGAGGVAVTPVPSIPAGGYGSAELEFCRSNEPGSEIVLTKDSMTIKHGSAISDAIKERLDTLESAVKYLVQKLVEAAKTSVPVVPIVPNVSSPTSFLPRDTGENERGGLNGAQRWNDWNALNGAIFP